MNVFVKIIKTIIFSASYFFCITFFSVTTINAMKPEASLSPTAVAHAVSIDTGGTPKATGQEIKTPRVGDGPSPHSFAGNVCFSPRDHRAQINPATLEQFDLAFEQFGVTALTQISRFPSTSSENFIAISSTHDRVEIGTLVDHVAEHREWFSYYAAAHFALKKPAEGFAQKQVLQKLCEHLNKRKPVLIVQRILFLLHQTLICDLLNTVEPATEKIIHELQYLFLNCVTQNIRIQTIDVGEEPRKSTMASREELFAVLSIKYGEQTLKKTLGPVAEIHSDVYRDRLESLQKILDLPSNSSRCC
jgi:hypothetical protein